MKLLRLLPLVGLLGACATLGGGSRRDDAARTALWNQAFDAYSRDSLRVSQALFQRLASEFPRTHEGHEARYYLGVISLDPRGNLDLRGADEQLTVYLADDSVQALHGIHRREAGTLQRLARQLRDPCAARAGGTGCDTATVVRTVTAPPTDAGSAEAARLRRQLAERDATIRELRAELERIRNTLAPRNPR
jgi:hypothetical protein